MFSFIQNKEKLRKHEKVCKDHDYCYVKMPDGDKKYQKCNPGKKSSKASWIIYSDLECLLRKIDSCQNDPKKFFTEKMLSINLRVTHGLHVVHLINQKTNGVIAEEKTVWKCFVNI